MSDDQCARVPLAEQLRSVPLDAKLRIDTPNALGCMDTRSIPVGRLCHEAADALGVLVSGEGEPFQRITEVPSTDASETVSAIYRALSRGHNREAQALARYYLHAKHERERNAGVTADAEARYAELLAAYHEACADAARGCTNWQPIVTVPKDGREVILREGSRVGAACWIKWPDTYDYDGAANADGGEGWTIGYDGDEWRSPTGWQPMPPATGVAGTLNEQAKEPK